MNITLPRAVIEQALGALEQWNTPLYKRGHIITALRTALEQPEQEPVAWMLKGGHGTEFNECIAEELKALTWKGKPMWVPLYTAPPQRKPLTDIDIADIYKKWDATPGVSMADFARAIEAAHGIKEQT